MGVPKELWVNWYDVGERIGFAYATEAEAAKHARPGTVPRLCIFARPKREAVAWVVRHEDGDYLGISGRWGPRVLAARYASAADAARSVARDARIVKLVRPVKP